MSLPSNELPPKCRECAKSFAAGIHGKCGLCQDLELDESLWCDLNRRVQKPEHFQCGAFRPILRLAGSLREERSDVVGRVKPDRGREPLVVLTHSNRVKYEKALALQQLGRDPEGVFANLKYHLAWNVIRRRSIFAPSQDSDFAHDVFEKCSESVGGFVSQLWLAPDHVHLYVDSDGMSSVETMVRRIKRFSREAILAQSPVIRQRVASDDEIWDEAYFVETLG